MKSLGEKVRYIVEQNQIDKVEKYIQTTLRKGQKEQ